jgi:hypothetical protein
MNCNVPHPAHFEQQRQQLATGPVGLLLTMLIEIATTICQIVVAT